MTLALRMFTNLLVRELWHGLDDITIVGSFGVALYLFLHYNVCTALKRPRRLIQRCMRLVITQDNYFAEE